MYGLLETLVFGEILQGARVACLPLLVDAEMVIVLGEGDSRFLVALLASNPSCRVSVVERSPAMLALARSRIVPEWRDRVEFKSEDVTRLEFPRETFDAVVTHFFLDCFSRGILSNLIPKVAASLRPSGRWFLADFVEPRKEGKGTKFQHFALRILYAFFRTICAIEGQRVVDPRGMLNDQGLRETNKKIFSQGLVVSLAWQKDFLSTFPQVDSFQETAAT